MKRYIAAVALMILSIAIGLVQGSRTEKNPGIPVLVASRGFEAGEAITEDRLEWRQITPDSSPEGAIREWSEGYVAAYPIAANSIMHVGLVRRAEDDVPERGHARTALRLTPDQALCWKLQRNEAVDVVFVDEGNRLSSIGKAVVVGWFDQQMKENENGTFLLLEAPEATVFEIVQKRDLGRIEIVKKE